MYVRPATTTYALPATTETESTAAPEKPAGLHHGSDADALGPDAANMHTPASTPNVSMRSAGRKPGATCRACITSQPV